MSISKLRKEYHQRICKEIIILHKDGNTVYPNFADKGSIASRAIANGIVKKLGYSPCYTDLSGQTAGGLFETITRTFLEKAFALLHYLSSWKQSKRYKMKTNLIC